VNKLSGYFSITAFILALLFSPDGICQTSSSVESVEIAVTPTPEKPDSAEKSQQGNIDYFSPVNIKNFAAHLFNQSEFERAAGEYDRLYYLDANNEYRDSALYMSGLSNLKSGNLLMAQKRFKQLISKCDDSRLQTYGKYDYARSIYFAGEYLRVVDYLQMQDVSGDEDLATTGALDLYAVSNARINQWQIARQAVCGNHISNSITACSLVTDGINLPHKSRLLGGTLSALVPGLGKLYTNKKWDALFAFMQVGTSAWQSYRGFDKDGNNSTQGWVFGLLGAGLYVGNIYGTVVSVNIYNHKLRDSYFLKFEEQTGLAHP